VEPLILVVALVVTDIVAVNITAAVDGPFTDLH
jgi:hypothetical protein